jgi:hypothetical protein
VKRLDSKFIEELLKMYCNDEMRNPIKKQSLCIPNAVRNSNIFFERTWIKIADREYECNNDTKLLKEITTMKRNIQIKQSLYFPNVER